MVGEDVVLTVDVTCRYSDISEFDVVLFDVRYFEVLLNDIRCRELE